MGHSKRFGRSPWMMRYPLLCLAFSCVFPVMAYADSVGGKQIEISGVASKSEGQVAPAETVVPKWVQKLNTRGEEALLALEKTGDGFGGVGVKEANEWIGLLKQLNWVIKKRKDSRSIQIAGELEQQIAESLVWQWRRSPEWFVGRGDMGATFMCLAKAWRLSGEKLNIRVAEQFLRDLIGGDTTNNWAQHCTGEGIRTLRDCAKICKIPEKEVAGWVKEYFLVKNGAWREEDLENVWKHRHHHASWASKIIGNNHATEAVEEFIESKIYKNPEELVGVNPLALVQILDEIDSDVLKSQSDDLYNILIDRIWGEERGCEVLTEYGLNVKFPRILGHLGVDDKSSSMYEDWIRVVDDNSAWIVENAWLHGYLGNMVWAVIEKMPQKDKTKFFSDVISHQEVINKVCGLPPSRFVRFMRIARDGEISISARVDWFDRWFATRGRMDIYKDAERDLWAALVAAETVFEKGPRPRSWQAFKRAAHLSLERACVREKDMKPIEWLHNTHLALLFEDPRDLARLRSMISSSVDAKGYPSLALAELYSWIARENGCLAEWEDHVLRKLESKKISRNQSAVWHLVAGNIKQISGIANFEPGAGVSDFELAASMVDVDELRMLAVERMVDGYSQKKDYESAIQKLNQYGDQFPQKEHVVKHERLLGEMLGKRETQAAKTKKQAVKAKEKESVAR